MRLRTCGSQTDEANGIASDSKGFVPVVRWMYSHSSQGIARGSSDDATTASSDWQHDTSVASAGTGTLHAVDRLSATSPPLASGVSGCSRAPPPRQARLGAFGSTTLASQAQLSMPMLCGETSVGNMPSQLGRPSNGAARFPSRHGSLTLPPAHYATSSGQLLLSSVQEYIPRPLTPTLQVPSDLPAGISTGGAPPPARRAVTPQPGMGPEVAPVSSSASTSQVLHDDRRSVTPPRSGGSPRLRWHASLCSTAREVSLQRVSRSTSPRAGRTCPTLYRYQGMTRSARSSSPPQKTDINLVMGLEPTSSNTPLSVLGRAASSQVKLHPADLSTASSSRASATVRCNYEPKPGLQLWDAEARKTKARSSYQGGPLLAFPGPFVSSSSPRMVSWVSVAPPNGAPPLPVSLRVKGRVRSPKSAMRTIREPRAKGLTTGSAPRPVLPSPVRSPPILGVRSSPVEASELEPTPAMPLCSSPHSSTDAAVSASGDVSLPGEDVKQPCTISGRQSSGPTPKTTVADDEKQKLHVLHTPASSEVPSVADVLKVGDPVIVRGRRGTVTWCGLPTHEFAAVRWLDSRRESEPMSLEIIDRDEEEREE